MKNLTFILLLLIICKASFAQKDALALDEHSKYIYFQLNDQPGLTADTLYKRCLNFLKSHYKNTDFKGGVTSAEPTVIKGKLIVYSNTTLAKHESGEVDFTLTMEFKDAKYRFWLTDFIIVPYQKDRYNIYKAIPGVSYPLEKGAEKLEKGELNNYFDQIGMYCKRLNFELKEYLANQIKNTGKPAKVIIQKW